ncbi:MAG TPA: 16S rRNA (cytidine(1402)-2'-O)-methyltransferase [Egibacteraceae bacterium]|nr:16S rRNA (cytidine(1402)-2'-O)-methyltransferase [Egibacteraceae bacterium]
MDGSGPRADRADQPARGSSAGRLVLVATPIGNLGDLSPRAAEALGSADVVAAEDTRRTGVLLKHIGVRVRMVSYHDHNEDTRTAELLDRVAGGETVAMVTDAGTPGLADPGYRLVLAAIERGLAVEAVPGPAAALQALVLSGLPMDRFAFEGFLPRKPGARARRLAELAEDPRTLVFYVAPHRAAEDLAAMAEAFGDRPAALARELTKLHEELWRDTLPALARRAEAEAVRGEVTVVVAGAPAEAFETPDGPALAARVQGLVAGGVDKKTAITEVATAAGVPRRRVYQSVIDNP